MNLYSRITSLLSKPGLCMLPSVVVYLLCISILCTILDNLPISISSPVPDLGPVMVKISSPFLFGHLF